MAKSTYHIDHQGNVEFLLRGELAEFRHKPSSIWERKGFALAVMAACCSLDAVMFIQLFGSILVDAVIVQVLSVIGLLIGFDISPVYLGILVRKKQQQFKVSNLIIGLLLGAFILAISANVWLRIVVKDIVLPDLTQTVSLFGDVTTEKASNPVALPYAIFASILPIVTSLTSFAASYMSSNPLVEKFAALQKEQIKLENSMGKVESILEEYEADAEFEVRMVQMDDELLLNKVGSYQELGVYYCDLVAEKIKEKLADPAATNHLSVDRRAALVHLAERVKESEEDIRNIDKINAA